MSWRGVLCTELPDNPSTSITNMAEILAAEVIARQLPQRFDEEEPVRWLEHYPPVPGARSGPHAQPRVDRVTFASWTPRKIWLGGQTRVSLGEPAWTSMPLAAVAALLGENELNDPVAQLP